MYLHQVLMDLVITHEAHDQGFPKVILKVIRYDFTEELDSDKCPKDLKPIGF